MATETRSLLIEPQTPLDGDLWQSYQDLASIGDDISSRLLPEKAVVEAEKAAFYADPSGYRPDLRPRMLDEGQLDRQEAALLEAKASLAESSAPDDIRQLYRWRLNERIGNARMLRAAYQGDMAGFAHYDHFVYGAPDQAVFGAVNDWFYRDAESKLNHAEPEVRQAAGQVIDLLGDHRGDAAYIIPSAETFAAVRRQHFSPEGFYALLLAGVEVPTDGKITPEIADPILRQALQNIGSDLPIEDASGVAWSIRRADPPAVLRPPKLNVEPVRFLGLGVGHEIGSHELEAQNGKRLAIQLARSGFDRYEVGNEGRGVLREQIAYPTVDEFMTTQRWQVLLRRHFATGVAAGLLGNDGTFPQVYEAINKIDMLYEQNQNPGSVAEATAHRRTWALLESTQKGKDGSGGGYSRYKIYLEGNVGCWQTAEVEPTAIEAGDLGKFDIVNTRHMSPLARHGVLAAAGMQTISEMVG